MLKATLLDNKPKIEFKSKKDNRVDIDDIKEAIEALGLKYKRVDELDIFNILNYIESSKKEHK